MVINPGNEAGSSATRPDWAAADTPFDKPSAARMYDYYLGGHHNFEIDRDKAEEAIALWPDLPLIMQANRAFLRRAVNYLTDQGINQFLDIGSGIPTIGNVHEIAQEASKDARVVYVDVDPVTVAHSESILKGTSSVGVLQGDIRQPAQILAHPTVRELLDFDKPVAVLMVAVLHFVIDDEEIQSTLRALQGVLASGSYIVIAHASNEDKPRETHGHESLYRQTSTPIMMRSRHAIEQFFDGFDLVDPGLVYYPLWRPEGPNDLFLDQPKRSPGLAGVGRKP